MMFSGKPKRVQTRPEIPDLPSQWESLLDQVWRCEADWRLWDRLDASVQADSLREKRQQTDRTQRPGL